MHESWSTVSCRVRPAAANRKSVVVELCPHRRTAVIIQRRADSLPIENQPIDWTQQVHKERFVVLTSRVSRNGDRDRLRCHARNKGHDARCHWEISADGRRSADY